MRPPSRLERRFPLLFGLLGACVVGLLAASWLAWRDVRDAAAWRDHTREVLLEIAALDQAVQPLAGHLLCAVLGASPGKPQALPDPAAPLHRLQALVADNAAQLRTLEELPPLLEALARGYSRPIDEACRGPRRLPVTRVLDLSAIGVVHRDRIHGYIELMRGVERRLLEQREARLEALEDELRQRFALLALATVALAALAPFGMRGVTGRLTAANRRLRHEAIERGLADEQRREAQRRLEMVLEHVNEAVIGLDERLRVQWLNPAGEAMFGRTRASLRGQPLASLLPGIEEDLQRRDVPPAPGEEGDPQVRREPWLAVRRAFDCRRADGVRFIAEAVVVHGRANGERMGVCVCRPLVERLSRSAERGQRPAPEEAREGAPVPQVLTVDVLLDDDSGAAPPPTGAATEAGGAEDAGGRGSADARSAGVGGPKPRGGIASATAPAQAARAQAEQAQAEHAPAAQAQGADARAAGAAGAGMRPAEAQAPEVDRPAVRAATVQAAELQVAEARAAQASEVPQAEARRTPAGPEGDDAAREGIAARPSPPRGVG